MQALVNFAPGAGNVELREVPEPVVGPGQAKIAVEATGICGTDIHIYDSEYASARPPVTMGHETAGRVVEVGAGVTRVRPGDQVMAHPIVSSCGHCRYCQEGQLALCDDRKGFGIRTNGAFAPYLVIPAKNVYPLPAGVDYAAGALAEPLACVVKSVNENISMKAGDVALVIGPGAIGLLAAQVAKARGAVVLLVGTAADTKRLQLAQTLGIEHVFQVETNHVKSTVRELTNGYGADVVIECSGAPAAVRMGLNLVRNQGQIAQMGLFGRPFELDYEQIALRDIRITGSFSYSLASWDRALVLLRAGLVQLAPLVSHQLPLSDWKRAFELIRRKEGLKIVLRPAV